MQQQLFKKITKKKWNQEKFKDKLAKKYKDKKNSRRK